MLKKSPSGSLCPYYYMGGELHPLKYGSYFDHKEALLSVIGAEEEFILSSTGTHNRRIWIDLYETNLDHELNARLAEHIMTIRHKIFKLCLVGCPTKDRREIIRSIKTSDGDFAEQIRHFKDPEDAKKWLVGEDSHF